MGPRRRCSPQAGSLGAVVDLEVLAKSPVSALLLAPSGRVVCQVRIGAVVEEAGHGSGERVGLASW